MIDFKRINNNPIWMRTMGVVAALLIGAIVLGVLFPQWAVRQRSRRRRNAAWHKPVKASGWRRMPAGTGPWGSGADRGNAGGYLCLGWNSRVESWDTLLSPVYCLTDTDGATLSLRTLLRFGDAGADETCAAQCQILASADGDSQWVVIRDYGRQDFEGKDDIPLPSSFRKTYRVRFALVSHVNDTADLRYWCIDDINLRQRKIHAMDMAISQSLNPLPGAAIPPSPVLPAEVVVANLGTCRESATVWILLDGVEVGARRVDMPDGGRIPMKFDVGGKIDNSALRVEHSRFGTPFKSSADIPLRPGPHTLTFAVRSQFDEAPGNDTLAVQFTVAGAVWQLLPGECPVPRSSVRSGFAVAGDDHGTIYVRNPGRTGAEGTSFMRLFLSRSLPDGNWNDLANFEPYLQAVPSPRPRLGGACVVRDSLLFCLLNDSGPLMKYDIAARRWGVTSYPTMAARRLGVRADFAGGVCWDEDDGLYVLGHHGFYRYSIRGDTWSLIMRHSGSDDRRAPGDTCSNTGDIAFLDGTLYTVAVDRSLIRYNIKFDCWYRPETLQGRGWTSVSRLAADPAGRRVYILTDCGVNGRTQFVAFSPNPDSWILDVPQPEWVSQGYTLMPGSALTRAGRYLVCAKSGSSQMYMFNLPMLADARPNPATETRRMLP